MLYEVITLHMVQVSGKNLLGLVNEILDFSFNISFNKGRINYLNIEDYKEGTGWNSNITYDYAVRVRITSYNVCYTKLLRIRYKPHLLNRQHSNL